MKILHSADWHLDAPMVGRTPEQSALLRQHMLALPDKITAICRRERCDLMLLCGDLFDGPYTKESAEAVCRALREAEVPVLIAPGNHDPMTPNSPWVREVWPENVHIFAQEAMEPLVLPQLDCRVYGAGFSSPAVPALLEGFRAEGTERYAIGMLHGDPTQANSPYCPITTAQVEDSALDYLALGHIHKGGQFCAGSTLCAWPGCPQGHGYDEPGEKGVLIVTLEETAQIQFLPLDGPRFYDLESPVDALDTLLPPAETQDFYRVTLTGESEGLDLQEIAARYPHIPNLQLRDRTVPPLDIWALSGEDTLEGIYFSLLRAAMEQQDEKTIRQIALAARISRQLLDGREVALP